MYKDILDITGQGFGRGYVAFGSSSLHEGMKCLVIDDLERLVAFTDPMNKFCTNEISEVSFHDKKWNVPGFSPGMLAMAVSNASLPNALKHSCN